MRDVNDILLPVVSAMLVLLIPMCTRIIVKKISDKLDEGRVKAEERAVQIEKLLLAYQKESESVAAQRHRDNVDRFDRIEMQTTDTNGKLAAHDKQITALAAQNELLIRLFPGPTQPVKGDN